MAIFQNDPFPGTRYEEYQTWERVTTPDGQTYYVVPGNAGYVFDPVASNATGRKVFRANPSSAIEKQQQEEKARQKAIEQAEFSQGPLGQAIPVAGTIGAIYAANKLGGGSAAAAAVPEVGGTLGSAAAEGFTGAGAAGVDAGGAMMPSFGSGAVAPSAPFMGIGVLPAAAIAGGIGLGLKGAKDLFSGKETKGWEGWGGRATLGVATGGLSELARASGVFGGKSTKDIEADRWAGTGVDPSVAEKMVGYDYFTGTEGQESRDEKFLTPDAIRVNPDNYNNVEEWDSWSKAEQDEFLTRLLAEGKVSERKGGIYYDDDRAKEIADEIRAKKAGMNLDTSAQAKAAAEGAISTPMPRGGRRG